MAVDYIIATLLNSFCTIHYSSEHTCFLLVDRSFHRPKFLNILSELCFFYYFSFLFSIFETSHIEFLFLYYFHNLFKVNSSNQTFLVDVKM